MHSSEKADFNASTSSRPSYSARLDVTGSSARSRPLGSKEAIRLCESQRVAAVAWKDSERLAALLKRHTKLM